MAAGFSLMEDQLPAFRQFLDAEFTGIRRLRGSGQPALDAISSPAAAGRALVSEIALAGPYGAGNPEPLLAFRIRGRRVTGKASRRDEHGVAPKG